MMITARDDPTIKDRFRPGLLRGVATAVRTRHEGLVTLFQMTLMYLCGSMIFILLCIQITTTTWTIFQSVTSTAIQRQEIGIKLLFCMMYIAKLHPGWR